MPVNKLNVSVKIIDNFLWKTRTHLLPSEDFARRGAKNAKKSTKVDGYKAYKANEGK